MSNYKHIDDAFNELADELQITQKQLINKGGQLQAYRTGNLHNTLTVEVKPMKEVTSVVSVVEYYGTYVNDGTYKMAARPFVQDSVDSVMKRMGNELLLEAGIKEIDVMMDKKIQTITLKN